MESFSPLFCLLTAFFADFSDTFPLIMNALLSRLCDFSFFSLFFFFFFFFFGLASVLYRSSLLHFISICMHFPLSSFHMLCKFDFMFEIFITSHLALSEV